LGTVPHLYENFYVFQYATGISAAHALAQRILDGDVATRDAYSEFLKSGTSRYPLDLLQDPGIDMTASAVVEAGFKVFRGAS
jgi:oligoendopeptidase F